MTQYVYNDRNRAVETVEPDGGVIHDDYDGGGRLASETDPLGNTTLYQYDTLGRILEEIQPAATAVAVNAATGATTTAAASPVTLYRYDSQGNLQYVTVTYSTNGGQTTAAALGAADDTTQYVYNALGEKTAEIDAAPAAATPPSHDALQL